MNCRRNSDFGWNALDMADWSLGPGFERGRGLTRGWTAIPVGILAGEMSDPIWAIGLMSGTSGDGIDAALLKTDGERIVETGPGIGEAYDPAFRARLKSSYGQWDPPAGLERELTERHAALVLRLMAQAGLRAGDIGVVGFHGQTILHEPERHRTRQIGDGALLAELT